MANKGPPPKTALIPLQIYELAQIFLYCTEAQLREEKLSRI